MKYLAISLAVLVLMWIGDAKADLFICSINEVKQLRESGKLEETDWTKGLKKITPHIVFDSDNALMRKSKNVQKFEIIQKGSSQNSLIATRSFKGLARIVFSLFKVKTWESGLPYLFIEDNSVYTGNCERLK
tara:strand:+ start:32 stop:427 length:396 start_codon:yes stop_codon:yes gene_type:complete